METEPRTWQASVIEALKESQTGFDFIGDASVYVVQSDTDEHEFYYVLRFDVVAGGAFVKVCTCRGFRFSGHCKHTERVP